MNLRIGSLFSGYGGLDLAFRSVFPDSETAWLSDVEPGPRKILARRFPNVPNLGDITQIDWETVEPVDIIIGGSPCQDLSMAGRRAGMKPGTRSGLWESMFHAIDTLRPRLVVWENVKGALSAPAFSLMEPGKGCVGDRPDGPVLRALGRVLGDLSSIGYDTQWTSLRASDVGAPHRRERIFLVAYPASQGWGFAGDATTGETSCRRAPAVTSGHGGALLPTPNASVSNDGEGVETWLARRRAVKEASGANNGMPLSIAVQLLPTPKAGDAETGFATTSGRPREKSTHLATRLDVLIEEQILSPHTAMGFIDWGEYAPAITRWEDILGRPVPEPTMLGKTGSPQLSPRFVEWMMGIPEGWVTDIEISRAAQLRALGNGVVPQQAAEAIMGLVGVAA